jgi:xylitol oxidase
VVGLGALGIVTKLTLNIEPAFTVRQDVYENLPFANVREHFEEIVSSGYSVSLFTDWQGARFNQVWRKRRVRAHDPASSSAADPEWFGARLADGPRHPLAGMSAENCTPQEGIAGPWHERLPHFRLEYTPSSGEELQSEYLLPRAHTVAALHAVHDVREYVAPPLQISEVRTVAADDLWMSPCYRQPCVALHFTWKKDWPAVQHVLPILEDQLAPFEARPHWGKLFTMAPARLAALYPRLPDFQRLLGRHDPEGKFRNAFVDTYLPRPDAAAP